MSAQGRVRGELRASILRHFRAAPATGSSVREIDGRAESHEGRCSGPGLCEVQVDRFQLSGSRKICISVENLEDENGNTES